MFEPNWVNVAVVRAVHSRQLAEHGGAPGIRDPGLLESSLAHPLNVWQYEESATVSRLAAAYGHSLARNHPVVDGNKRVALVAMLLFLDLNGQEIAASEEELYVLTLELSAGHLSEKDLTTWLEGHCRALDVP